MSMLDRFTWFKQSAYLWRSDGVAVYIDPWGVTTDDPADAIFITHAHFDHFNMENVDKVVKDGTKIFAPRDDSSAASSTNPCACKPWRGTFFDYVNHCLIGICCKKFHAKGLGGELGIHAGDCHLISTRATSFATAARARISTRGCWR